MADEEPMQPPSSTPSPVTDHSPQGGVVWRVLGRTGTVLKWLFIPPRHGGYKSGWKPPRQRGGMGSFRLVYNIVLVIGVIAFLAAYFHLVPSVDGASQAPQAEHEPSTP